MGNRTAAGVLAEIRTGCHANTSHSIILSALTCSACVCKIYKRQWTARKQYSCKVTLVFSRNKYYPLTVLYKAFISYFPALPADAATAGLEPC
jgi:hypothetical protein